MRDCIFRRALRGAGSTGLGILAALAVLPRAAAADRIDFSAQIRPILSSKCFACHGPDEESRKAKLRLDLREEAVKERTDRTFAIKPGDPRRSQLIVRVTSRDPDEVMPPPKTGHAITPAEAQLLRKWIQQGALYTGHWAFARPIRPALPTVKNRSWARSAIDRFILARLEADRLAPAPAADRYILIRRVSFDLTGLPPTPAEVDAFVHDPSAGAYETLVDRLLASPAYGERWARPWLDLARYADSAGYGSDPLRPNVWPWRDWVIRALNENMPFDRFTREQIAGDLLPDAAQEDLIATAFHRNTMTNTEGGTDDEEWRVAAVKDRINVTVQAWMGLTMGCAQCHTHKFDPITQKEYYQFFAIFNQTEDNDQPDERPTLALPTPEQLRKMTGLTNEIRALEQELEHPGADVLAELATWEKAHAGGNTAWTILPPVTARTKSGAEIKTLDDSSLLVAGESPEQDTYTVTVRNPVGRATAVRLEVLPDDSLPAHGPGRATNGSFVLSNVKVQFVPDQSEPKRARFVRIELAGKDRMLSLAEVQVFSSETNVARGRKASQSSTDFGGEAVRAIDGKTDGRFDEAQSTTHTRAETDPWWEVDLGAEFPVESIAVWSRTDGELHRRLDGFRAAAFDAERALVWETRQASAPKTSVTLSLTGERVLTLNHASADASDGEFKVEKAIDSDEKKSGWSAGPGRGRAQRAVFEMPDKMEPGLLRFTLAQTEGRGTTLGRFRFSVTADVRPVRVIPEKISAILARPAEQRTEQQQREITTWFVNHAQASALLVEKLATRKKELSDVKPLGLPVMRELSADKRRKTRLLNKGNFLDPGEEVRPSLLGAFHSPSVPPDRLGVAEWLVSRDNPLTARVLVNRYWSQIFGTGLVETEEDFGTQGALPSHPELLDWLAVELMEPDTGGAGGGGARPWDLKRLLKSLVLSATYQQSSRVNPKTLARDPRNRLLSHFPRARLDAEMVRDQALAVSGLLSRKIGGASVYPPQPDGLWKAAFNSERTYVTSKGEDRYRRGLYTVWRRTVPYPSMATFDAPSRETCTFRRLPTNTPLQAFVTLNDPVYVEAAQGLARRLMQEGGATPADRIRWGLRLVLARPATEAQVAELTRLYESEQAHYRSEEAEARRLATDPLGPLPERMDAVEAAAWTVVANVLLNLDGVLTKG